MVRTVCWIQQINSDLIHWNNHKTHTIDSFVLRNSNILMQLVWIQNIFKISNHIWQIDTTRKKSTNSTNICWRFGKFLMFWNERTTKWINYRSDTISIVWFSQIQSSNADFSTHWVLFQNFFCHHQYVTSTFIKSICNFSCLCT